MLPIIKWRARRLLAATAAALLLTAGAADARPLRPHDRGPKVRALNEKLIALGYLPSGSAVTTYGSATFHAVMAVQKLNGLARDGVAGPRTLAALKDARRPSAGAATSGRRIDVLLGKQVALLISGGKVRRTISVSTGAAGYDTPRGTFRVSRKERMSWSVPYKVWLPYASYFNGGIAFHESDSVPAHAASHGCVRIPKPFAAEVYEFASLGTRVRVL